MKVHTCNIERFFSGVYLQFAKGPLAHWIDIALCYGEGCDASQSCHLPNVCTSHVDSSVYKILAVN